MRDQCHYINKPTPAAFPPPCPPTPLTHQKVGAILRAAGYQAARLTKQGSPIRGLARVARAGFRLTVLTGSQAGMIKIEHEAAIPPHSARTLYRDALQRYENALTQAGLRVENHFDAPLPHLLAYSA